MKLKIAVTKLHIDKGKQDDAQKCAIALAIRDVVQKELKKSPLLQAILGKKPEICVEGDYITIGEKSFDGGTKAAEFIDNFDNDKSSVKPTEITLQG